jgi:dienelactone hydrolase
VAVVVALALLAAACDPVVPIEEPEQWVFEGFEVYSYVPEDPVGIVHVFHGSGGSAAIATRVEITDQLNELVARGYGWVATESTQRTGDRRWNVIDPDPAQNPDLARLARLHDRIVDDTDVTAETPIFGIGMSNGARMVTLFAQVFADSGRPVAAVAPFMGRAAPAVKAAGGLRVPAYWVIAENDTTVDNAVIEADQRANAATGVESRLVRKAEEPLLAARFTRIPQIDAEEAEAIRAALEATGGWDADGVRVLPVDEVESRVAELTVPRSFGAPANEVRAQAQAILAVHQFVAFHKYGLADFFDAQLAG